MRGSIKDAPKPEERCKHSANVALTTEYVFRGISQTSEGPAIQGGYDLTCGIFYAGVWASNLDWGGTGLFGFAGNDAVANIEMDWYLGIKPVTGRITWDLGVIYYTYPNAADLGVNALAAVDKRDYNYLELKVGASAEIWKDGTLSATAFWSPDYQYEVGPGVDVRRLVHAEPARSSRCWREWSPSFSALIGYQTASGSDADKSVYRLNVTGDGSDYLYWNVGLHARLPRQVVHRLPVLGYQYRPAGQRLQRSTSSACDERFVGTLKFTF